MLLIRVSIKLKVKCFLIRYFSYTQNVDAQFGRATCLQGFFRKLSGKQFRGFGKRKERSKAPSLSGGAGEKACFRDGASNRLAWKLAEFRDKVKRRQTSGEFLGVPISK